MQVGELTVSICYQCGQILLLLDWFSYNSAVNSHFWILAHEMFFIKHSRAHQKKKKKNRLHKAAQSKGNPFQFPREDLDQTRATGHGDDHPHPSHRQRFMRQIQDPGGHLGGSHESRKACFWVFFPSSFWNWFPFFFFFLPFFFLSAGNIHSFLVRWL